MANYNIVFSITFKLLIALNAMQIKRRVINIGKHGKFILIIYLKVNKLTRKKTDSTGRGTLCVFCYKLLQINRLNIHIFISSGQRSAKYFHSF